MKQKIIEILKTSLIDLGYPNIDPIIQKPIKYKIWGMN